MKLKISRPRYSHLWNSEFPVVIERTVAIADKYDMTGMLLGKSFGELSAFDPRLKEMSVYVRRNEKLAAACELDVKRDTLITGIRKVVRAFEDVDMPVIRQHYEVLDALLEKHQSQTIAKANLTSETDRLNKLEKDIASNPLAQEAFAAFGLAPVVRCLFETNREYDVLFREYIADKSVEEYDVAGLRRECTKAVGQFFDAIQYCAFEHENIDYTALVKELNQLNGYYRTQLKARDTRRKNNKKDKGEQIPPPPSEV